MTSLKEFLENLETEPEKETTYKIQVRGSGGGRIVGTLEGKKWSSTEWTDIDFYKQINDFWKETEHSKGIRYSELSAKEAEETLVIIRDHIRVRGATEVRAIQEDDVLQEIDTTSEEKLSNKVERARLLLVEVYEEYESENDSCICQNGDFQYRTDVVGCICCTMGDNPSEKDHILAQYRDFLAEEGL